jgi:hypothetical protein
MFRLLSKVTTPDAAYVAVGVPFGIHATDQFLEWLPKGSKIDLMVPVMSAGVVTMTVALWPFRMYSLWKYRS